MEDRKLVKGGQGRSAAEVEFAAYVCLASVLVVIVALIAA